MKYRGLVLVLGRCKSFAVNGGLASDKAILYQYGSVPAVALAAGWKQKEMENSCSQVLFVVGDGSALSQLSGSEGNITSLQAI